MELRIICGLIWHFFGLVSVERGAASVNGGPGISIEGIEEEHGWHFVVT